MTLPSIVVCLLALTTVVCVANTNYNDPGSTAPPITTTTLSCPEPFQLVADTCTLLNPMVQGTWQEIWNLCLTYQARMAEVQSVRVFEDLLNYIRSTGVDEYDYWVGGGDWLQEGNWTWDSGTQMAMGSPYWAYTGDEYYGRYDMEPLGGETENCAYLDHERFHYIDDGDCDIVKSAICQIVE